MKSPLLIIFLILMLPLSALTAELIVGTHYSQDAKGLFRLKLDDKGQLSKPELLEGQPGSVITLAGPSGTYYTCGAGKEKNYLKSYKNGRKTAQVDIIGERPCHMAVDRKNRFIFTANIRGGSISSVALNEDGSLKSHIGDFSFKAAEGRKFSPHAVAVSPDNRYLFIPDISGNRICRMEIGKDGTLKESGSVSSKNFHGPRHMTFSADGNFAYLISQMGGSVTAFNYKEGVLEEIQHLSALDPDYQGKNHSATIHIHPDGDYLYTSHRGPDTICVMGLDKTNGRLTYLRSFSCGGRHPWSFAISPDGRYLVSAGRGSNNLTVFALAGGELKQLSQLNQPAAPVSLSFLKK